MLKKKKKRYIFSDNFLNYYYYYFIVANIYVQNFEQFENDLKSHLLKQLVRHIQKLKTYEVVTFSMKLLLFSLFIL